MSFKEKYEEYVLHHAGQVAIVENALRSLSYIIPGRLKDAEIISELVYSSVSVLGIYHDSLFLRHSWNDPGSSLSNRYVGQMASRDPLYKKAAFLLVILRNIEVVLEMGGRKVFANGKWTIAFVVEFIKVLCRLALLKSSGGKLVPDQSLPDSQRKDSSFALPGASAPSQPLQTFSHLSFWKGTHTQKLHPKVSVVKATPAKGESPALAYVTDRALLSAKDPKDLVAWSNLKFLSEVLYILRPLAYVIAIIKYGEKSWRAWSFSFLMELASYHLLTSQKDLSQIEKEEAKRRQFLFVYYLLRGPMFHSFTKEVIDGLAQSRVGSLPLISLATGSLRDYSKLWEKYHFYTSTA